MNVVEARGLDKAFGGMRVLRGLDWTVAEGTVCGLLGRNGAGKTTLFNLLVGLYTKDAGELRVRRSRLAYIPEIDDLPAWATIDDTIAFERRLRPRLVTDRLEKHLAREGLARARRVKSLSKGQKRRVAIELALATEPELLVADEPFDGLDPVSRAEALEGLVAFAAGGGTIVMASHILGDLERACDRIAVLSGGQIACAVPMDELKEDWRLTHHASGVAVHRGEVVASRSDGAGEVSVIRGIGDDDELALVEAGFRVWRPSLDELGVELLRCLEEDPS